MGSVTAIINPLNSSEALLFYCTDTYNLAVEHRALNQSAQSTTYTDNNVQTGNITQPGDFAVVRHNNLIQCYGITNFTGGDGKSTNVASSISPSINPLDRIDVTKGIPATSNAITGTYSALAATTDGEFNDFVTFIRPDISNPAVPELVEYHINLDVPAIAEYESASSLILPSSRLATCYRFDNPDNRYILAQLKSAGNPIGFMKTDEGTMTPIKQTNNAAPGNPFAVTTTMNAETNIMSIYLFYMDNAKNLNKVIYNGSSWGEPKQVANNLQDGSGIAVINDNINCYAFYAKAGARTFTMYTGRLNG
ncbi:hypothetical protein AA313_de0209123 [Arthrobotrys entomopaga]|nr:hypothetical protein AA313_de0209123 [Arthrobotrys entomopaga]